MQGGGPTRVINSTLVGVARQARVRELELIGVRRGIEGILGDRPNIIHFSDINDGRLDLISRTPGAALGTTRVKPTQKDCEKIVDLLIENNIKYLFYIGGNDTALAVQLMDTYAKSKGADIVFTHVIKTIDNDVPVNDHTPGYGSAARYVASVVRGAALDNLALPGIYLAVTMGRNAGFLTAASALARSKNIPELGPHIICLPEKEFVESDFLSQIHQTYSRLGRAVIVVSEGIWIMKDGQKVELTKLLKEGSKNGNGNGEDGFYHPQLSGSGALADHLSARITAELNIRRVRGDTLGYAQRSFLEGYSEVDWNEALMIGVDAVNYAVDGHVSGSVALLANRGVIYRSHTTTCGLSEVADKVRVLPEEFIATNGHDITPAFIEYLTPLIGIPLLEVDTFLQVDRKRRL